MRVSLAVKKNLFTVGATVVIVALSAMACRADTAYAFSFDPDPGLSDVTGTITGTVMLPSGDGMWSADSLTFTSLPNLLTPDQSGDVVNWAHQIANQFVVTDGQVTAFQFLAVSTITNGSFSLVCMSNWLDSKGNQTNPKYDGAGAQCPTYNVVVENFWATSMNQFEEEESGLFGDTFGAQGDPPTGSVPEPGGFAVVGLGLAIAGISRRKQ